MIWKEEIIFLSSVDMEDDTFKITTEENTERLSNSIKRAGLINPPIVIRKKSRYAVVSGFRRIKAIKNLGWSSLTARALDTNTTALGCAKLAITDNSLQRPLNLIETSRCYKMLSSFYEGQDLFDAASLLGLSGNPQLVKKIINLCDLPASIQNHILSDTVSMAMALELAKPEYHESRIILADVFDKLKLSLNKQREFIALSYEIAAREGISVMKLIKEDGFQNILSDENLDRNQKTQKIRRYLKIRRFPSIKKAEYNFERNVKKLGLAGGVKLIPPANFEGNTFIISMEFKKIPELDEQTVCLNRLVKDPVLQEILSKHLLNSDS